jgi:hypothetical protein
LLAAVPSRGEGLNIWLFKVARYLWAFRTEKEIIELLYAATNGLPVRPGEIERAVKRSRACAWNPEQPRQTVSQPAWPKVNVQARAVIIAKGGSLADLWEASPIAVEDDQPRTEKIVDQLFRDDPLLCCGISPFSFVTQTREEWRGKLSAQQFIVPSPMTDRTGPTQDGNISAHALSITGPRLYLVIEQDSGAIDEQAAILLHLSEHAPLVLAVHSGGKSIHGWFACFNGSEPAIRGFMEYAVSLGADHATWTRSQFVRMPDGTRENGNRQTVFYFNPENLR